MLLGKTNYFLLVASFLLKASILSNWPLAKSMYAPPPTGTHSKGQSATSQQASMQTSKQGDVPVPRKQPMPISMRTLGSETPAVDMGRDARGT